MSMVTEVLFDVPEKTPEADRLEVLVMLVERYEAHHYPIPAPDPIDFLNYAMETRGLTRATACHGLMKKSALNTGRGDTASHL